MIEKNRLGYRAPALTDETGISEAPLGFISKFAIRDAFHYTLKHLVW